jgi:hypothetical protein
MKKRVAFIEHEMSQGCQIFMNRYLSCPGGDKTLTLNTPLSFIPEIGKTSALKNMKKMLVSIGNS